MNFDIRSRRGSATLLVLVVIFLVTLLGAVAVFSVSLSKSNGEKYKSDFEQRLLFDAVANEFCLMVSQGADISLWASEITEKEVCAGYTENGAELAVVENGEIVFFVALEYRDGAYTVVKWG